MPAFLCIGLAACESEVATPPPAGTGTTISAIQGAGASSPLTGRAVTVEGLVTGDFQHNDADTRSNLGGFYIQQEKSDGDPTTSDGIFVFDGNSPAVDVTVGDRVEVAGTVKEYFGETQIAASTVQITGTGTLRVTELQLPAGSLIGNSEDDDIADFERFEGMLVRFPQTLSITDHRFLEQFGELRLSQGGRLYQFTNGNTPGAAGYSRHRRTNAARTIVLDDGLRSSYPENIRYLNAGTTTDYSVRAGDTIANLTGNLRYARGSGGNGDETWRLMPTEEPKFSSVNPRPGAPVVGGSIRIASFNVLNFFSTVDAGQAACGPKNSDRCRGADSDTELGRQLDKTVSALTLMDADIVGLMELENNAGAAIAMVVDALNARTSGSNYAYIDTGTIHDGAIKTGFVYKPATVQPVGDFALLHAGVDPRFDDSRNRPALAQSFETTASGARLTVVVNHLKSKGSACDSTGDFNAGDGQGNCNATRTAAATAIADWLAGDPTGSGDPDHLIIGDLNAYAQEDPLTALENAGMVSLLDLAENPYSFLFDGQSGALDHAIASVSLAGQVVEAIEWHINADEPALLDYNLENDRNPDWFDADLPYRASDHDPVIIGLDLTN